ncbi:hypothetical protein C2845_PM07G34610 [Panicum miliaceum]|uniref:At1g61320/AtMIF1 LRR domain-containing protein n=1 Tax=Panicum miliaceum TaxID=4540 RepID=A0A3L6SU79_PANMI|nr:hypothetical protein C2845_PM07G34610 [Panicum miliaceum]
MALEFALTSLPNLLPSVQNLILHSFLSLEIPLIQGSSSKFSQLKYLQLSFFMLPEDLNNLLCLVSFLSAAPFIEKLEINFTIYALSHCSELIQRLPQCTHSYMKELSITGFAGCTGQVEFLVYIVENSPYLEVLTIDRADHQIGSDEEYERRIRFKALDIARIHLDGRVSQNTKIVMM